MKVYYIQTKKAGKILSIIAAAIIVWLMFAFNGKVITTLKDFRTIYEGEKNIKAVALTINVDWGEENIPAMLELLKKENVKATFFITGRWAKLFPDLVKQIAKEGHEIGNHGYYHKHHEQIGFESCLKEIKETELTIYNISKVRTKLFAPPYGEKGEAVIKSAYAAGYRTVFWTIDTIDWRRPAPQKIVERVQKLGLSNGGIILMHPTEPTVKALPQIISYIKSNNYQCLPVSKIAGGY